MTPDITAGSVWSRIPKRGRESNKGSFGAVLAGAGQARPPGAAGPAVGGAPGPRAGPGPPAPAAPGGAGGRGPPPRGRPDRIGTPTL